MINTVEKEFIIREAISADYAAWDLFTESHPNASPYHLIAWKKAIEEAYFHECFYLIAEHNTKIVGILPLVKVSPPFLKGSICSLPFCDIGGPLVTEQNALPPLLARAKTISQTHSASQLSLRENSQLAFDEKKSDKDLKGQKVRMILALPESSEALMKSFKSKLRSQIKKAEKNGISYTQSNNQSAIDAFYSIMQANMRLLGSPVHSKKWFEWHSSPRNVSFEDALEEFTNLFDTVIKGQTGNKKVILPKSNIQPNTDHNIPVEIKSGEKIKHREVRKTCGALSI